MTEVRVTVGYEYFIVPTLLCSLRHYLFYVADIIIGVPSLQAHNLDAKIREERCRYLVAELVCRVRNI
jgi:hypothetical protein